MAQVDENVELDAVEEESEVIEGVVADVEVATDDDEINSDVAGMLSLEELIKNHVESMEKLRVELKKHREMLDDSFNNNPTYREHVEKVKDVTKGKNSVKQQIAKQPSVALLDQKVKDLRFDINEKNKTLSDLLQDYKEQTGATSIETRNGQVLEIVSTSKLVKK